ncbi:sodium ion-translocating decarboxylase subunit beta [Angelakisella massiliensis]|uniref:sodium ion-translocating decarboxylase subunit beta n=1 Tax=Angelakisella massiliensis TaxID=1871018 RepID=UPI0008F8CA59|nr:sodium ion-translocating decarboxylase subunit beta [Angelakisella massiliensis]
MNFIEIIVQTFAQSGFAAMTWQQGAMLLISFVLLYMAIVKKFEPLLLVPIAFGMMLANLPEAGLMYDATAEASNALAAAQAALANGTGSVEAVNAAAAQVASTHWYNSGVLRIIYSGVKSSIFPCLIFMGVGAMTDFGPLLANPASLLLGAAAQLGIYVAFTVANLLGTYVVIDGVPLFTAAQAAAIGIIGGADGPTAIFLTNNLAPELLAPIAVAAYSYMALIPLIQPPIMRALTTKEEREIKMSQLRKVSKTEKIVFPIVVTVFCVLLLPSVAPLIGMLMLGNLFRECGCTERLSDTAQNALCNIVTIMLGTTVGATADGLVFLRPQTLAIVFLGLFAFCFSTAGGVLLGKVMCALTHGKVNPLIGSAGVSAVPMAARVSQVEGAKANPTNFLLMHAMGPNVAGVIGSAVAAGFLLMMFK